MNTCPTVKEISIPGCYSGVLKVNTSLSQDVLVRWLIRREGSPTSFADTALIDAEGNLVIDYPAINYFGTYKLEFFNSDQEPINIKGYDCYRLMPFKNTNEVVDVII